MQIDQNLTTPITSLESAKGFLMMLEADGKLFHPEDDPETVVSTRGQVFTAEEVPHVRLRIDEVYSFMEDPCQFILDEILGTQPEQPNT